MRDDLLQLLIVIINILEFLMLNIPVYTYWNVNETKTFLN